VADLPVSPKTTMTKRNSSKKKKKGGRRNGGSYRSSALSQGAGQSNQAPFPISGRKRKHGEAFGSGSDDPDCLDAFCPAHLALPRAVAPYIVVRVTSLVSFDSKFLLFGPMMTAQSLSAGGDRSRNWCNQVGIAFGNAPGDQAGGPVTRICLPEQTSGFVGCQLTPAAFSVQVMNPGALQTTRGILAMGRLKLASTFNGPAPAGAPSPTVAQVANNCVSYFSPRLMAAAKVAMRGVQNNAIPVDMNDLSEFTPYDQRFANDDDYNNSDATSPPPAGVDAVVPKFHGFAPIFISNPDEIPLQFLVSTEYRVRFDPSNPATAGATMHKPASTQTWDKVITGMVARGNGVVDIAEKVVEYGQSARKLIGRAGAVAGLLL